jgi:AcrR family transcriptional regulator
MPARSRAKQAAILVAARDSFLEHGFESVSMDLVASTAGVGKATIYSHFGSKVDLFRAIVEKTSREIVQIEMEAPDFDKPIEDWLSELAVTYARKLYDPRLLALLRLAIGGSQETRSAGALYLSSGPEPARQALATVFRAVDRRGVLDIDNPVLAADQFTNMIVPERLYALLDPTRIPPRSEIDRQAREGALRFIRAYSSHIRTGRREKETKVQ